MRHFEADDCRHLEPEPWMLEALKTNPSYVYWGPHEEYMMGGSGWSGPLFYDSWTHFGPWNLSELNEVVNFYFHIERDSTKCAVCDGSVYAPETKMIADTFWTDWADKITLDELQILIDKGRIKGEANEELLNLVNCSNARGTVLGKYRHDGYNASVLIRTRAERLGYPLTCQFCDGDGWIYCGETELKLTLWFLVPRKGCSRGVEIGNIREHEVDTIKQWLRGAAERNAQRFAGIM